MNTFNFISLKKRKKYKRNCERKLLLKYLVKLHYEYFMKLLKIHIKISRKFISFQFR